MRPIRIIRAHLLLVIFCFKLKSQLLLIIHIFIIYGFFLKEKRSTRSTRSMRSASLDSPRKNKTTNQANRASYSSRSRSRSPSRSTSRSQSPTSRSISKTSPRTTSKSNKNNSTSPIRSGVITKKLMPKYDQASKRTFVAYGVRSKSNQSNLSKCSSESYPGFEFKANY